MVPFGALIGFRVAANMILEQSLTLLMMQVGLGICVMWNSVWWFAAYVRTGRN